MRQTTTDNSTYEPACSSAPRSINTMVSRENEEKVVNPPSTPTATNNRSSACCGGRKRASSPMNTPISTDPMILMSSVANGNDIGNNRPTRLEKPYRAMAPTAPPAPTNKIDRKSTRLNSSHVKISYAVFC